MSILFIRDTIYLCSGCRNLVKASLSSSEQTTALGVMTDPKLDLRNIQFGSPTLVLRRDSSAEIADALRTRHVELKAKFLYGLLAALLGPLIVIVGLLGPVAWIPSFGLLGAALVIVLLIRAFRQGRLAFWCSTVGGAATTTIAFLDWVVCAHRFPASSLDLADELFEALLFAIIGLLGGLWLAALPSKNQQRRAAP